MTKPSIINRLEKGETIILDGGTGSELQSRGVNISQRTENGELGAWSATANIDAPNIVREIHEDYIRSGAEIITTNSFWSNRTRLDRIGLGSQMEKYTQASVILAKKAIENTGSNNTYIAGSMAPPQGRPKSLGGISSSSIISEDLYKEFLDQSVILAETGVDFLLLEYVSSVDEATMLVKAASETRLPIFLGIKHFDSTGTLRSKENTIEAIKAVADLPVAAILDMCSSPEDITDVLPLIKNEFKGPVGAYANIGYIQNPDATTDKTKQVHRIETAENTPERYAKICEDWISKNVQIVGGCCASNPKHISAIRKKIT